MSQTGHDVFVGGARILVVDDDTSAAQVMVEMVLAAGAVPVVVHSGTAAIEYCSANRVDLVLLDLMLPDILGHEVARRIKEICGRDDFLPVIMISGTDESAARIKSLAWADDFLTKNFDSAELVAHIRAMLRIRQLQKDLVVSRNRYQSLYEHFPIMCLTLDKNCTVVECNAAFLKTCPAAAADVMGQPFECLFEERERPALQSFFAALEGNILSAERHLFRMVPAMGRTSPLYVSLRGMFVGECTDDADRVVIMQDMTENLRLEEEQKVARRQLYRSARMVSIGTLASGVAHELNNPLAAILGFADALLQRVQEGAVLERDEFGQYLGIVKTESLRCRDIIENLLKFSRDFEPMIRDISLYECVSSSCMLVSPRAVKKGIVIDNSIAPDIVVSADPQKLRQVFVNILSNAVDFCSSGASVVITLDPAITGGPDVRVLVCDTGPGINAADLPRVFDPFFTTKEVGQGMGVGLAICHKIMEECEGNIDIQSEMGRGTTVQLDIPRGKSV